MDQAFIIDGDRQGIRFSNKKASRLGAKESGAGRLNINL